MHLRTRRKLEMLDTISPQAVYRTMKHLSLSRRILAPGTAAVAAALTLACSQASAADSGPARGASAAAPAPIRGPFWSGTIMRAKDKAAAMKGLAVTLGTDHRSYVVYDLDTLRMAVAWQGEFLEFGNTLTKIEWPPPPSVKGTNIVAETELGPGWADAKGNLNDPRERHQGPLPKEWAHYSGAYVNGDSVVIKYTVGTGDVWESPSVSTSGDQTLFVRSFEFGAAPGPVTVLLAEGAEGSLSTDLSGGTPATVSLKGGRTLAVAILDKTPGRLEITNGRLVLRFAKRPVGQTVRVALSSNPSPAGFLALAGKPATSLSRLTTGGPARWTETITTQGKLGTEDGPYVVDTLTEPFPNPYNVSTFLGGHDFLPDGRIAVCTFHGDVWIVSGTEGNLDKLFWKRFATGMFQPLGLKVVDGKIYVAGRDQITRLHDLNGDGEADYYENFNNDTVVTPNYHEFVLDLHTDSKGNFYYAKGAPWEPSVSSPHQGCILKVSPDGKKMEVYATGLRAPNGMTVGPDDTILVGDNQGHWMPSSKLNLVKPGSFMGMVPAAQRGLTLRYADGREIALNPSDPEARKQNKLKGWDKEMPIPVSYDEPIAWVPMRWDNSSGGQVYVTSSKWGPWEGAPLFMSYGKCLLYGVLWDEIDGTVQASLVPFNLKFQSGVMRGRFSPRDGQLYLSGLKGWQNAATRDGGLYRVRYTGKAVRMPVKSHVASNGIEITFSCDLDSKTAADPTSYSLELWNYRYSGGYGSDELSVKTAGKKGHDKLEIKSAKLYPGSRTVFLEVDGLERADQYGVKFNLDAADGTKLSSEIIGTIRRLGAEIKSAAR